MINKLLALYFRPERDWDPVPYDHAKQYADQEWAQGVREELLDELEAWVGGFSGKRVLDLGGGPGQYSVAFAKRGASVTWHDVSRIYRQYAEEKATAHGVSIVFSLGYLDEAPQMLNAQFDLVFNRICWYYGFSDRSFAKTIFSLVRPGGVAYVDTTHSMWRRETLSLSSRLRTQLNDLFGIKIGHPFPPHGRLAKLFLSLPIEEILVDYRVPTNDRIIVRRARA